MTDVMGNFHKSFVANVVKMALLKQHTQSILDAMGRDEEPSLYDLHGIIAVRDWVPYDALVKVNTEVSLGAAPSDWMPCDICDPAMQDRVICDSDPKFRFQVKAADKTWTVAEEDVQIF